MDLTETLEVYFDKAQKLLKSADKFVNGEEKQLVIEVGSHTTKLVEYVVKSGTIEVTAGAVVNTPINAIKNDRLMNNETLSNILSQVLKQEKIRTKEFVASIVSKEIITREMNVPNMREQELKSFVQINSNDIFPVKLANYVLAYNILEKGKTNRVMIAAIPKDIVLSYIDLADKLGLKLKGINYSGYELYNFLDFELDTNEKSYLAVDIGAKNTNIVIISNGILKFNKIIPKGLEETTKYISEEFECTFTKAEQLKRQYNTIEASTDAAEDSEESIVAKYTRRCIDNVMQDLLRIIEFFNSNNAKNKVSQVYILGTAGKIKGIEQYISNKLNVTSKSLKLFSKVNFARDSLKLKPRQQSFINCFGAHKLKDRNFYFIKGDLKFRKLSFILKSRFHKLAICAIIIMLGIIIFENNSLVSINDQYNLYNNYIEANSELISTQREIQDMKDEISDRQQIISSLPGGVEGYINILDIIDETVTTLETDATISIVKYRFQRETLEIRGRIDLPAEIDQTHPDYSKYTVLPYSFEESVEASIKRDVNVSTSSSSISSIDFVLKTSIK